LAFTVTDLLPGSVVGIGHALAINGSGVVVGVGTLGLGFVWTPVQPNSNVGTAVFLPADISPAIRPVTTSTPQSINAAGIVVGVCETVDVNGSRASRAFKFNPGDPVLVDLGTLKFDAAGNPLGNSDAKGINDSGRIVGSADDADFNSVAFMIDPGGSMTALLSNSVAPSDGAAVNAAGSVVGSATVPDAGGATSRQAIFIDPAVGSSVLGTLIPSASGQFFGRSAALAISRNGTVVGNSDTNPPVTTAGPLAVVFSNPIAPFVPLPGSANGVVSIQTVERTVGTFTNPTDSTTSGFVFDSSHEVLDLNTQLADPDWHIDEAAGINEVGQICGTGTHATLGGPRAVLLTP
jgi:probable HAF family extracellular repeat protein